MFGRIAGEARAQIEIVATTMNIPENFKITSKRAAEINEIAFGSSTS